MNVYYDERYLQGSDITETFKDVFTKTELNDCEYVVITSIDNKISLLKEELHSFIKTVREKNKKILFFGQGDIEEGYIPELYGFNFKNNLYKSKKYKNEFSLTSLASDRAPKFKFIPCLDDVSVGFCGATDRFNREYYLNEIKATGFKTDFIIKNGPAWGTETPHDCRNNETLTDIQNNAKNIFYKNILNNLFTLCIRGWGNYSYRFCQTICLGRIPILIDTDCSLPYEEIFDYENHIIIVKSCDNINQKINQFLKQNADKLVDIQQKLYKFGNTYLTPDGYFKNINKLIENYECSC